MAARVSTLKKRASSKTMRTQANTPQTLLLRHPDPLSSTSIQVIGKCFFLFLFRTTWQTFTKSLKLFQVTVPRQEGLMFDSCNLEGWVTNAVMTEINLFQQRQHTSLRGFRVVNLRKRFSYRTSWQCWALKLDSEAASQILWVISLGWHTFCQWNLCTFAFLLRHRTEYSRSNSMTGCKRYKASLKVTTKPIVVKAEKDDRDRRRGWWWTAWGWAAAAPSQTVLQLPLLLPTLIDSNVSSPAGETLRGIHNRTMSGTQTLTLTG